MKVYDQNFKILWQHYWERYIIQLWKNHLKILSGATGNNSKTASELCSSQTGWSLPHQKQLMQAYINGSWDKNLGTGLEGVNRNYWSATTNSNNSTIAWYTNLSSGTTLTSTKTNANYVRCVRPAIWFDDLVILNLFGYFFEFLIIHSIILHTL